METWHLTPEYILENWTREEFDLMLEKMNQRYSHQSKKEHGKDNLISDKELFARMGIKVNLATTK